MAVFKGEKPLWGAGPGLSGPVIGLTVGALLVGVVNRSLLRSPTVRGLMLAVMALSILALGMLLWGMRPGSRRFRRWDVRLAVISNAILLVLLGLAFFLIHPGDGGGNGSD